MKPSLVRQACRPRSQIGRHGTTAVEFAFVAPVLVLLLMLVVEVGWQLAIDMALNIGVTSASRYGITGLGMTEKTRDGTITSSAVTIAGGLLDPAYLTTTTKSYTTPAVYAAGGAASGTTGASGQFVVYTYTYRANFLTGFPAAIVGSTYFTHTATALVQNEPF